MGFPRCGRLRRYLNYPTLFTNLLAFGMVVVIAVFVYYNQVIVSGLKADASRVSRAYARLWQYAASEATSGEEINFIFEEIIRKATFPIIVTTPDGEPMFWTVDLPKGLSPAATTKKLQKYLAEMDADNQPVPIYFGPEKTVIHLLHYGDSRLIKQLQLVPMIEISVIGVFILIAFIGFRNIKRSEQRSIWVGMAKETAHQLGTPLSSLLGWTELLKRKLKDSDIALSDEGTAVRYSEILARMEADLKRLDRIATRFGQIGSIPELEPADLRVVISEVAEYFRGRLPGGGKGVEISEQYEDLPNIKINRELMAWVIENLLKNSLEAVDPKIGRIILKAERKGKKILISVIDNGKGIPRGIQGLIFMPGFSTKQRGWGLGLTLARRIVEEYHGGRIWLEYSEPMTKTEFRVELPI